MYSIPRDQEQKLEAIEFPYTYSKGSVSVKIYKTPNGSYDSFTLMYYQDGARKRTVFATFEAALEEAKEVARLLGSKDVDVLELRSADKAAYQRAVNLLAEVGTPIEVAVAQFVEAKKFLGDTPLITAVEYYAKRREADV